MRLSRFSGATGLVVGLGALILCVSVRDPGVRRAVLAAAVCAVVVQIGTFMISLQLRRWHAMAAWAFGVLSRFATLAAFGFLVVPARGLLVAPALLSLAGFLFLTTLIEPWFLRP